MFRRRMLNAVEAVTKDALAFAPQGLPSDNYIPGDDNYIASSLMA